MPDNNDMKHNVSNLIPKSEGHNITAEDMLGMADIANFINFAESVSWQAFGQVRGAQN